MQSRTSSLAVASWALSCLVVLAAGCGPNVTRLSLHDNRLPVEARRWLADAEDEVAISNVELDAAEERLAEAREFSEYVDSDVARHWPRNAQANAARQRLERMAEERIELAENEIRAANARIALAHANLVRARAETAMRHDLAAYDLEPITEATDAARAELDAAAHQVELQRVEVDEATTAWWQSYGAYLQGGGDANVLWLWED